MSDMRCALLHGNKTTSGGTLIGTGDSMTHHGTRVAVEGDFATCPACKVGGPVINDCEPNFRLMGKSILVEGARVLCQCQRKPLIIASQNTFTIEVNRSGAAAQRAAAEAKTVHTLFAAGDPRYDQRIQLLDEASGAPLAHRSYRLTG
ncbi:MAG TPA: PAAR domain-containing protein, partial [Rhizobacter sp.]